MCTLYGTGEHPLIIRYVSVYQVQTNRENLLETLLPGCSSDCILAYIFIQAGAFIKHEIEGRFNHATTSCFMFVTMPAFRRNGLQFARTQFEVARITPGNDKK